jgi:endoglucanase
MNKTILLSFIIFLGLNKFYAQPAIYTDPLTLVTGTWTGPSGQSSLTEIMTDGPYEGSKHYRFNYNFTAWWAGMGLNFDDWGNLPSRNFSSYQYIKVAYKGMNGGELRIKLRQGNTESNEVYVGGPSTNYKNVYIPLSSFTGVNLSQITEINFSIGGIQTSNSFLYLDDIKLTNTPGVPYNGANSQHTSINTWRRHAQMDKGINCANWLEAYWLLPYNAYPESNKYNRNLVQNMVNIGIKNFRLPVCFERVANASPPYTIPINTVSNNMWRLIDSMVLWAEQMNFSLIITNHHGYEITNSNFNTEITRKTAIWNQVMTRYSGLNPEKYFFELLNEPTDAISNDNLYTFYNAIISAIRLFNTDHSLITGGNLYNSALGLRESKRFNDPNIIYTFHDYEPYLFTHQGLSWTTPPNHPVRAFPIGTDEIDMESGINGAKIWADTSGVPLFCGEIGCSTSASASSRCNWINFISNSLISKGIPYYYWDAITLNDAFGFYNTSNNTMTSCFASALELGSYNTCAKFVTNTQDVGDGSLRDQLSCAKNGDTITISSALAGDTIKLFSSPVVIHKNVTIITQSSVPVYLTSTWSHPLISVAPGKTVKFVNLRILGKENSIFSNLGTIELVNGQIIKSPSSNFIRSDGGNFIFDGNSTIR